MNPTHLVTPSGFVRPLPVAAPLPPPPRASDLIALPVAYSEHPDGRVHAHDRDGHSLGLFTNRAYADRTVAFLSR